MKCVLDNWLAQYGERLNALPRESFGLFFAYMAERLLPLYVAFERKHKWGDVEAITSRLVSIWDSLRGSPTVVQRTDLDVLGSLIPSGEQFDSPDSTYAQDVVICIDAALRALIPDEPLDGNWLEYAVEPVKTKVSIAISGYTAVEGSSVGRWEADLVAIPEFAAYLRDCEDLIARLESMPADPNVLCMEARSKQLRSDEYIRAYP